jgi:hypothetical protein
MKWFLVFFIIGVALAPVGFVALIKDQPYAGAFSFTVPPGEYYYLPLRVVNGGRVSGNFVESQGQLVSLYVFNQQQFDEYQIKGALSSLFSTTNLSQGTYSTSISAPGTYYVVTAHGTGYDQTSQQLTLTVRVDGTNLPYLGLESLVPIALGLLAASYLVQKRQNRQLILSFLKMNPNFGPGQGMVDDRILGIAKELCLQLRLSFVPVAVYWVAWLKLAGIRAAPSDLCLPSMKGIRRGYLQLPASLRGRLEPDAWRPLIASSLVWFIHPDIRRRQKFVQRLWISTILAAIVISSLLFWFLRSPPLEDLVEFLAVNALFFAGLAGAVLLITFSARKGNMVLRKYFLEADRLAAGIVGREALLHALRKIDSMKLPDLEERNREKPTIWRKEWVLPWPSVQLRIQNLEMS